MEEPMPIQNTLIGEEIRPKEEFTIDYISGKRIKSTPKEPVRQIFARKLVEEYGYSKDRIQTVPEFYITKGTQKIGPKQVLDAKRRSFWLDGYLGGGVSWQRFIARLALHGPVTPLVPASLLQTKK